jgi:hypothetical protein
MVFAQKFRADCHSGRRFSPKTILFLATQGHIEEKFQSSLDIAAKNS